MYTFHTFNYYLSIAYFLPLLSSLFIYLFINLLFLNIVAISLQYKDAFFSAHPNFKWYKLPAPPLRTISTTRPDVNNTPTPYHVGSFDTFHDLMPKDRLSRTNIDFREYNEHDITVPKNGTTPPKNGKIMKKSNIVGVFKFADEAQMGGLSSLMQPQSHFKSDDGASGPVNYDESGWCFMFQI